MIEFDEQLSLGYRSDAELAEFLKEIGDEAAAGELREAGARGQSIARLMGKAYTHTAHVVGYIPEGSSSGAAVSILPAFEAEPDHSLVGTQIKVTLDAFQVAEYPGLGQHTVLFDFQGRDQAGAETQDLQFASVRLPSTIAIGPRVSGVPIFTGLTVPRDGLSFKARTILIANKGDQTIIDVLQSSAFKDGLKLMGQIQPALPQLVSLAGGIAQNLLKRPKNEQVQLFDLGLDFGSGQTSARLRRGSYVVVQVPGSSMWRWDSWKFDPHTMSIVDSDGRQAQYNTIVFGVTTSGSGEARSALRQEGRAALDTAKSAA